MPNKVPTRAAVGPARPPQLWKATEAAVSRAEELLQGGLDDRGQQAVVGAGWGIAWVSADGEVQAAMSGPVWNGLPQTAPSAEMATYAAYGQILNVLAEQQAVEQRACVDCALILATHMDKKKARHRSRPLADMVREVASDQGTQRACYYEVKAHEDWTKPVGEDRAHGFGNEQADMYAKEGRLTNTTFAQWELTMTLSERKQMDELLAYAQASLRDWKGATWQQKEKLGRIPGSTPADSRAGKRQTRQQPALQHRWRQVLPRLWRCALCQARSSTCPRHSECNGVRLDLRAALYDERRLGVEPYYDEFLLVCLVCGATATGTKARQEVTDKAARLCVPPTAWGTRVRNYVAKLRFPSNKYKHLRLCQLAVPGTDGGEESEAEADTLNEAAPGPPAQQLSQAIAPQVLARRGHGLDDPDADHEPQEEDAHMPPPPELWHDAVDLAG